MPKDLRSKKNLIMMFESARDHLTRKTLENRELKLRIMELEKTLADHVKFIEDWVDKGGNEGR
jgi:hypothetical protein